MFESLGWFLLLTCPFFSWIVSRDVWVPCRSSCSLPCFPWLEPKTGQVGKRDQMR